MTGQLFIYHTIKAYGALLFATVMTTRQFLSILLSCLLFVHPLTAYQWLGTVIVFGTLYYKAFGKKPENKSNSSTMQAATPTKPKHAEDGTQEEKLPVLATKDEYEKKDPFETA